MSGTRLNSTSLILWLSLAVGAVATGAGCSSSDVTDAVAGQSGGGKAGKAGSHSTAEAGDATDEQAGAPGEGGTTEMASGGTSAGGLPPGGAGRSAGGTSSAGAHAGGSSGKAGAVSAEAGAAEAGTAGASEPTPDPNAEAKERALALINGLEPVRRCTTCHQPDYAGLGFYPNLTPDETNGIGSWSDAQIKAAIHEGKRNDGGTLCLAMERYPFSATELDDLVIYLRSVAANPKKNSAVCPH